MSIKKLAKSINNLADAIRYHADGGATSASMTRSPMPEGSDTDQKFRDALRRVTSGEETPQPLTEAEENFVDPYDAPPRVNDPKFMAGFDAGLVPAFQTSDGKSLNDAPPPESTHPLGAMAGAAKAIHDAVHAPGWQTLTVEELDAPSVEVDADGLPWDERIHSGGKTLLVDGTWRLKRGVPDDEYQEVVAGLKKLMAIPAPDTVTATLSPTKPAELGEPVDNTPPPPPIASVPTPPAHSTTVDNLPAFIKAVTGAQLDKDVVLAAVKNAGLENVMQLGARPDLIAGIAKELGL